MAKVLTNAGIITGQPVEAAHVSQSVNALTAAEAYDINISGSLTVNNVLYPIVDGTVGQVLTTNGAGVATFQDPTAITASYITSSGVHGPFGSDSILTSSYSVSSSRAEFATEASTSIFAIDANTAINANTASLAITASYITASGVYGPFGSSSVESASIAVTASYISSSNVFGPFGLDSILSASFAITAAYAENAGGATIDTSSFVITSSITGFTQSFTRGDGSTYENYIQSASFATSASFALTASYIETAEAYKQDFVTSSVVTVNHDLGTNDLLIQVYRQSGSGDTPTMIIPDNIELTTQNTAVVTFPVSESGYVVVSDGGGIVSIAESASFAVTAAYAANAGGVDKAVITSSISGFTQSFTRGDGTTYENYIVSSSYALTASYVELDLVSNLRADFVNVTSFTATHAFDTENVIVQVYESSSLVSPPRQIQPSTLTVDNRNQVTATFAAPTTGYIVINNQNGFISSGSTEYAQTASYVNRTQRNLQDGEGIIDFYFDGSTDALVTLDTASARFRNSTVLSSSFATTASFAQTASFLTGEIESSSYAGRAEKTRNVRIPIYNDDNRPIAKGDPVYIEEFDGTVYKVRNADAADASRMPAIGVSLETIAIGEISEAVVVGELKGINTFGLPLGRNVYVASGSGFTITRPTSTSEQVQPIGVVAEESVITGRLLINGPMADISTTSNRYTEAVAGSNTYTITHNLSESLPIVQSYTTAGLQLVPSAVQVLTANSIQVSYAATFNGNIIVQA